MFDVCEVVAGNDKVRDETCFGQICIRYRHFVARVCLVAAFVGLELWKYECVMRWTINRDVVWNEGCFFVESRSGDWLLIYVIVMK